MEWTSSGRIATNAGQCSVLREGAELVRGLPFLVRADPSERWFWKIYVHSLDVAGLVQRVVCLLKEKG